MAVTYGFYNSLDGDRKYDAVEMSAIFDGIIEDGVHKGLGNEFALTPAGGLAVNVGTGRAWFRRTWTLNDTELLLTGDASDAANPRIDAYVLEVNTSTSVRQNTIKIIKGTPAAAPQRPPLVVNPQVRQYPLGWILRKAGIATITAADITKGVGTAETPYAASKLVDRALEPVAMHRNAFRGKNLGTALTAAQSAAIANGMFDDLYVGDYWVINSQVWRIVDIDYWYGKGDITTTEHHVVVMPDRRLGTAQMNTQLQFTGGFVGSNVYVNGLSGMRTLASAAFPNKILNVRQLLTNAIDAKGFPVGVAAYLSSVLIPNTYQMFGTSFYGPMGIGETMPPQNATESATQFALFNLAPQFIPSSDDQPFWLRDIVANTYGAIVGGSSNGLANRAQVTTTYGLRPVFAVR